MKPDVKAFPILKLMEQFARWYVDVLVLARAQGMDCIFDRAYIPVLLEDQEYFYWAQCFMYAALRRIVKPPELREFIDKYAHKSDAQAVIISMVKHTRKSTQAIISQRDNMSAIVNARMSKKDWKGPALDFIIAFDTMMNEYNVALDRRPDLQIRLKGGFWGHPEINFWAMISG